MERDGLMEGPGSMVYGSKNVISVRTKNQTEKPASTFSVLIVNNPPEIVTRRAASARRDG